MQSHVCFDVFAHLGEARNVRTLSETASASDRSKVDLVEDLAGLRKFELETCFLLPFLDKISPAKIWPSFLAPVQKCPKFDLETRQSWVLSTGCVPNPNRDLLVCL